MLTFARSQLLFHGECRFNGDGIVRPRRAINVRKHGSGLRISLLKKIEGVPQQSIAVLLDKDQTKELVDALVAEFGSREPEPAPAPVPETPIENRVQHLEYLVGDLKSLAARISSLEEWRRG